MPSCCCQAPDHEADHANPNHGLTMVQAHLVIPAKPARFVQPTKGAFDDPSFWKHLKPFGLVAPAHDLQLQFAKGSKLLHPAHQFSPVTAIGPDDLQPTIQTHQELDQPPGRVAVLYGSGRNPHRQNQSQAIHRDMALTARHLFSRVVAAFSGLLGGLDRLAVDNGRGRCHLAGFGFSDEVAQGVVNESPRPILTPAPEATIDGLPRAKVAGQQSPGATGAHHVKDSVDQVAPLQCRSATLSLSRLGWWNQGLDVFPFGISQISGVTSWMRLHPLYL